MLNRKITKIKYVLSKYFYTFVACTDWFQNGYSSDKDLSTDTTTFLINIQRNGTWEISADLRLLDKYNCDICLDKIYDLWIPWIDDDISQKNKCKKWPFFPCLQYAGTQIIPGRINDPNRPLRKEIQLLIFKLSILKCHYFKSTFVIP